MRGPKLMMADDIVIALLFPFGSADVMLRPDAHIAYQASVPHCSDEIITRHCRPSVVADLCVVDLLVWFRISQARLWLIAYGEVIPLTIKIGARIASNLPSFSND